MSDYEPKITKSKVLDCIVGDSMFHNEHADLTAVQNEQLRSAQATQSGRKDDSDKPMLALIPSKAEIEEARVWTFGAGKYEQWNWTKGFKLTRIISALQRHLNAIKSGEDRDPESGCLHAAHVRCCAAMLIEFQGREDLDDRQPR